MALLLQHQQLREVLAFASRQAVGMAVQACSQVDKIRHCTGTSLLPQLACCHEIKCC